MYIDHYKLKVKPFQISSDPRFLWLGENHREALAVLQYGILDNKGFLLLTGDVGTGKTTLINALVAGLGDEVLAATVPDPGLELIDFYNYVANAFGKKRRIETKGDFLLWFRNFLNAAYQDHKRVLLIVDESQRLTPHLLEEIRLLSNIEKESVKLLNIFFVGQNEFQELLWQDENRALRQRITINYLINPLTDSETGEYIRHRLKIAGSEKIIFTPDAITEINGFSGGFPRTINIICDHALLTGYVAGVKKVDGAMVKECANDLRIPKNTRKMSEPPVSVADAKPRSTEGGRTPADNTYKRRVKRKGFPFLSKRQLALAAMVVTALAVGAGIYYHRYLEGYMDKVLFGFRPVVESSMGTGREPAVIAAQITGGDPAALTERERGPHPGETVISVSAKPLSTKQTGAKGQPALSPSGGAVPATARDGKKRKKSVVILFKPDSNEIPKEFLKTLDHVASQLDQNPATRINVVGYTDASGVYSYNKSLSRFRANIIKSYLVAKGVDQNKIAAIGMGPKPPGAARSTAKGIKPERRIEIEFVHTKQ